jgi:dTDP-4-dehydrorhamnose reductase
MNILIIGSSGLIGSACYNVLKKKYHDTTGTFKSFQSENAFIYFNSLDPNCLYVIQKYWDVVIHTGALTNVDLCEIDKELSYKDNVFTTKIISENILKYNPNCQFIYLSTDYVFDGLKGPYFEYDNPNPINVYGKHKLECEEIVRKYFKNHIILRVTNVYGNEIRNKNFISRLINTIENNLTTIIHVPFDQFATPVDAFDIAKIVELLILNCVSGTIHVGGEEYMNRYQLANKVLSYFPENKIILKGLSTKELNQSALRPLRGGLISHTLYNLNSNFIFSNIDHFIKNYIKNAAKEFKF